MVRAPGARERDLVLKEVYQMSEAQFRQYWIAKVFRAEAQSSPQNRIHERNGCRIGLGYSRSGCLHGRASQVPKGLKVLKINVGFTGREKLSLCNKVPVWGGLLAWQPPSQGGALFLQLCEEPAGSRLPADSPPRCKASARAKCLALRIS